MIYFHIFSNILAKPCRTPLTREQLSRNLSKSPLEKHALPLTFLGVQQSGYVSNVKCLMRHETVSYLHIK